MNAKRWRLRFVVAPCTQLRVNFKAGLNQRLNRIRRRLSAIGRYLESTDYFGQASRRYRRHAAERQNAKHQAPLPPNDERFIEHCGHCNRKVGAINMVFGVIICS